MASLPALTDLQFQLLFPFCNQKDATFPSSPLGLVQQQKDRKASLVYVGDEHSSECHYCNKNPLGRISLGMSSHWMRSRDYMDLMDRGWRRSGTYIYHPSPSCCCAHYTIRLPVHHFSISRSQKKTLKKMVRYFSRKATPTDNTSQTTSTPSTSTSSTSTSTSISTSTSTSTSTPSSTKSTTSTAQRIKNQLLMAIELFRKNKKPSDPDPHIRNIQSELIAALQPHQGGTVPVVLIQNNPSQVATRGHYSSNIAIKISSLSIPLRKETKLRGNIEKWVSFELSEYLKELFNDVNNENNINQPQIKVSCSPNSFLNFFVTGADALLLTDHKTPTTSTSSIQSNDSNQKNQKRNSFNTTDFKLPITPPCLQVEIVKSSVSAECYAVYEKYQTVIHNDPPSDISSYRRFLVTSPLVPDEEWDSSRITAVQAAINSLNLSCLASASTQSSSLNSDHLSDSDSDSDSENPQPSHQLSDCKKTKVENKHEEREKNTKTVQAQKGLLSEKSLKLQIDCTPVTQWGSYHIIFRDTTTTQPQSISKPTTKENSTTATTTTPTNTAKGRVIGVSVVDLVESALSSVYYYYDPEYESLSTGVFSALFDIALVKAISTVIPSFKYYYMGYYIPTCPKMRYKGKYRPSELLCPTSFEWVSLSECSDLIESSTKRLTLKPNPTPTTILTPQHFDQQTKELFLLFKPV